jgi:hypothetical protein
MNFEVITVDLLSFFINFFSLNLAILLPILVLDYVVEYCINKLTVKKQQQLFRSPLDVVASVKSEGPLLLNSR